MLDEEEENKSKGCTLRMEAWPSATCSQEEEKTKTSLDIDHNTPFEGRSSKPEANVKGSEQEG
jgi:hypothetical protein